MGSGYWFRFRVRAGRFMVRIRDGVRVRVYQQLCPHLPFLVLELGQG